MFSGGAHIIFGGPEGDFLVVIPAGVGHCDVGSSGDFRVVGAYPRG